MRYVKHKNATGKGSSIFGGQRVLLTTALVVRHPWASNCPRAPNAVCAFSYRMLVRFLP